MTRTASAGALLTTLALAAAAWVAAVQQMHGMDMGPATQLGSFRFFVAVWVLMTTAMMLPGAGPAIVRHGALAVPAFAGSYLAIWTLVGVGVYLAYRPHGAAAAGALTIAAGAYELTPVKRECRRRCRERLESGLHYGVNCVGSSIGLMAVLAALGLMSLTWMAIVTVLVSAQKLLPPRAPVDVALALALVALGIVVAV